jgi:hypothetical protein
MRKLKLFILVFFQISFLLTSYGSDMKPTQEELFIYSFISKLYTFENKSLKNLTFYKSIYPKDNSTLRLKKFMSEKIFDDFVNKNLYYNYIISSYDNGFDSSVYYIKLKRSKPLMDGTTYSYSATLELFFGYNSKREIYQVNGEITVSKLYGEYKITKISALKFPTIGSSNVVSKLV